MGAPIPLIELSALPEGRGRRVCAAGLDLAVFRVGDAVYAIDDSCPHAGASLSNGRVHGTSVSCPVHGLRFKLENGHPRDSASLQARTHAVRRVDGMVLLDSPVASNATDRKPTA